MTLSFLENRENNTPKPRGRQFHNGQSQKTGPKGWKEWPAPVTLGLCNFQEMSDIESFRIQNPETVPIISVLLSICLWINQSINH